MSHRLENGVCLHGIYVNDVEEEIVGESGVAEIVVQHEPGGLGPMPWARVNYEDGGVALFNLSVCVGVVFEEKDEGQILEVPEGVVAEATCAPA